MSPAWLAEHVGPDAAAMMQTYGIAVGMGHVRGDRVNLYMTSACPKCDRVLKFAIDFRGIMRDGREPMKLMVHAVRSALEANKCTHIPEKLAEALELYRPIFQPYIYRPSGLMIPTPAWR
jgi:actin-like ATPase involved in cell morphogenesis